MKRAVALATRLAEQIEARGGVTINPVAVLDRSDAVALERPGMWSANRSCRLVRTGDGWIAVNLARADDVALVPAWLQREVEGDAWRTIVATARGLSCVALVAQARLIGLPVSTVGERASRLPSLIRMAAGGRAKGLRVIDLSSLWAGPLCASILAAAGGEVVKVESRSRPDTTRDSAPALDHRLNGTKRRVMLDFGDDADRVALAALIAGADVVVTNARRRAFAPLGIAPEEVFAANPALVWVAISGHGWNDERVAFGDDAAAAGGLVRWTAVGPRFVGDAVADPLTGLAAAVGAFEALAQGGGMLVDAAMAAVAASAAEGTA